ncbi:hypothetical protein Skr01_46590 [Sphaerisporangium krabiense]|uniref:Aminoglycoside phosphotransferase domain-containing protein n=1 Tax=Sphaerisporangium krabiense TaxID=763782 RepID=A0A7W9DQA1_9ACTN|nr:hypothetical protein [Sphaerisporangium krabiense]MBB5627291.1 hypothetical protein [Sphaerisporangium krabiense]GII64574.1 hypothetical protein Skr01_46590 [Sphaerisporangium krabiense]
MRDFRARLRYLDEVILLLYPPEDLTREDTRPDTRTRPRPTLRTPDRPARPITEPVNGHAAAEPAAGRGPVRRDTPYALVPSRFLPRRLVPRSLWLPGRRRLPSGPGTIEGHLADVLGRPVTVLLHVRPARRANRKPILEVRTPSGEPLAFVKVGDTDRSRALVRHESATLRMLAAAPLSTVVAPTVLHHGTWNGLEVLALSPLPTSRRRVPASLLERAIAEIATLGSSLPHPAPRHHGTPAHHEPRAAGHGPWIDLAGGHAWHGDFAPWNVAPGPGGRLLVWDWERFETGVPLGFDALHHFFQRALKRMSPEVAAAACLAQALPTLAPFGLSAGQARQTAVRYLIALADRHERDGLQPLGPPERWLAPLVDHQEVIT